MHSHFIKLFAELFCYEGQESLDAALLYLTCSSLNLKIWSSLTISKVATLMVVMVEEMCPGDKLSETSKCLM